MSKILAFVGSVAVVVLAVVTVPAFIRARNTSASNACVMHLRQIDGAKETWALDLHKATNDVVSWNDIKPYLSHEQVPHCPDGGTYIPGRVGEAPRCSLAPAFVGGKSHDLSK
ncbi:MAG: hypothetical protein NTW03_04455 [Verrucomicrobia bacterium]|nr:hypothetical protein [Verrucomicrobiota bacterium]